MCIKYRIILRNLFNPGFPATDTRKKGFSKRFLCWKKRFLKGFCLEKKVLKGFFIQLLCIDFNRLTHKQAIVEIADPTGRPQSVYFRYLRSNSNSESQ